MLKIFDNLDAIAQNYDTQNMQVVLDAETLFDQYVDKGIITVQDCTAAVSLLRKSGSEDFYAETFNPKDLSVSAKTLALAYRFPYYIYSIADISPEAAVHLIVHEVGLPGVHTLLWPPGNELQYEAAVERIIYDEKFDYDLTAEIQAEYYGDAYKQVCGNLRELFAATMGIYITDDAESDNDSGGGDSVACMELPEDSFTHFDTPEVFYGKSVDPRSKEECIIEARFDWNYKFGKEFTDLFDANGIMDRMCLTCDIRGCDKRIRSMRDCCIVADQFIVYPCIDKFGDRYVSLHSPFGIPVPDGLHNYIIEYFSKTGHIAKFSNRAYSEEELSELLYNLVDIDFRATHVVNYRFDGNKPVITSVELDCCRAFCTSMGIPSPIKDEEYLSDGTLVRKVYWRGETLTVTIPGDSKQWSVGLVTTIHSGKNIPDNYAGEPNDVTDLFDDDEPDTESSTNSDQIPESDDYDPDFPHDDDVTDNEDSDSDKPTPTYEEMEFEDWCKFYDSLKK